MEDRPTVEQYRRAASRLYGNDGEIEVDADARVSRSDDGGAYVQAWLWVDDSDATKETVGEIQS